MKTFATLPVFMASALAAPTFSPFNFGFGFDSFFSSHKSKCPTSSLLFDGKLPTASFSASGFFPISAKIPNKFFPAAEWATVTPNDLCTVVNLEVDAAAAAGKLCNLVFNLPEVSAAAGLFSFKGAGSFSFTGFGVNAGASVGMTSYNKQPGSSYSNAEITIKPGGSYILNSAPCGIASAAGKVSVSGSLCSKDTTFSFKQSNKTCPLGFYVVLADDPNGVTYAPGTPANTPDAPTYAPDAPADTPSEPTYAPDAPADTPSEPTYAPDAPADTPSEPIYAPDASSDTSDETADAPTYSTY